MDGLRGIAILLVLLFHLDPYGLVKGGSYGVTVFFVLSGFLITSILLGRPRLVAFYKRRAMRLLPPLLIFCVVMLLVGTPWADVWPGLFYVASIVRIDHPPSTPVVDHLWSLSVEEHFYLVWPWFLAFFRQNRVQVFGLALTVAALWRLHLMLDTLPERIYFATDTNAFALLAGCWLAAVHHQEPLIPRRYDILAVFGVVVASMAFGMFETPVLHLWGTFSVVVLSLLAVRAAMSPEGVLNVGWLRWLGVISYALYLWHPYLMQVFEPRLGVLAAIGVASVSWLLIERPLLERHRVRNEKKLLSPWHRERGGEQSWKGLLDPNES